MFHLFGKNKDVQINDSSIYNPIDGKVIPIEQASDAVFASKSMGNGFAVLPIHEIIRSPTNAEVVMIADTKHAIGLKMYNGQEILIHMGVDTVELNGDPFRILVRVGDIVEVGQRLALIDLNVIKKYGLSTDIMIIFMNHTDKFSESFIESQNKKSGDLVLIL